MKTIVTLGFVILAAALAGCAPAPLTKADVDGRVICNADQMDQVERSARRDGKALHWVNCPQVTLRAT